MRLEDAMRDAPNFVRNAQDVANRKPGNPDTLYMWDNQVTAIEQFLATTEDFNGQNPELSKARQELRALKKTIQTTVLEFELQQEGQQLPPEPTEEEVLEEMMAILEEVKDLCSQLGKVTPKTVQELQDLEEPRQQLNAFLADSEPLVGKNPNLDKVRVRAKRVRKDLEARIDEVIKAWRQADLAGGDDDDE